MAIKDPIALNAAQDQVFVNKSYWPADDGTTFCNVSTQDVLLKMGYAALEGLNADEMYAKIVSSPDWLIKPMADCQALVNAGTIILGILPSYKLGQAHGHVNSCTTGQEDYSGHWDAKTPLCCNLGRAGTCFRAKGENWAFQMPPEFYALISTL
jgi:hypothetical protein